MQESSTGVDVALRRASGHTWRALRGGKDQAGFGPFQDVIASQLANVADALIAAAQDGLGSRGTLSNSADKMRRLARKYKKARAVTIRDKHSVRLSVAR